MINTTLIAIKEYAPCTEGWRKLLKHLGKSTVDDEPLPLVEILKSNGFDDALWCLRAVDHRNIILFAIACAREVQHLMTDRRSVQALDVAEAYVDGKATWEDLEHARRAAYAAYAAYADAAAAAAAAAAYASAASAAYADASAASASAASAAYASAAYAKERQTELFIKFFGG